MSTTPRSTNEPTPKITNHAVLRYRQRIDASEPFPEAKLIDLLEVAQPDASHPRVADGVAWVARDAILITDSAQEAVTTVLRREDR